MASKTFEKDDAMAEPTAGLSLADLVAALKAATGNDDESMRKRAQFEAEAHKRLEEDENRRHPAISVYNPLGERDHPRPPLKCEMNWVGYPLTTDNLSPEEITLLNQAVGGEFQYHKTDGAEETLKIKAFLGLGGALDKLDFTFPCRGDLKTNQPAMTVMLREAFGMPDELTALRAALAEAQAKLAGQSA